MMLVFTHLVMIHWHYYLICCPAVALLCGTTLARWEIFWIEEIPRPWLRLPLVLLMFILSAIGGIVTMNIAIDYDSFPKKMSRLIRQHTKPDDKLIVFKGDPEWPGELLFLADRRGFFVPVLEGKPFGPTDKGLREILGNESDMQRLRLLGYNKLVLVGESPTRYAVEASKPGDHRERFPYPATISPEVDGWPVVYRSEEILIREIPK